MSLYSLSVSLGVSLINGQATFPIIRSQFLPNCVHSAQPVISLYFIPLYVQFFLNLYTLCLCIIRHGLGSLLHVWKESQL